MSTPADARRLRAALAADAAGRSLIVVDTHADYDHAWGNSVFADVPIIGHAAAASGCGAPRRRPLERWKAEMPGRFDEVVATPPSILHGDEGLVLDGGDLTIELIATPGHTDDHVSLYVRELGILLAGDAAEVPFPHVDSAAGLVRARASLRAPGSARRTPRAAVPRRHHGSRSCWSATWPGSTPSWPIPELPYEKALERFGDGRGEVLEMYRSFHADACRAAALAR